YLSPPHMSGNELGYVREAFESNWLSSLGENITEFEKSIISYTGCAGALALSTGTAALHLGLKALNVQRGDYVLVSSLTFSASV
ncbi:DegT/DnrJ/EryC1/StrS family aminotransferase, partial [Listeria monocytogenes]|uniref:DegT/DnrJ/EryC1/StrS family aminotransferase n=1 Tax=Listeria monocytogenes TaxID=1639 RepID=UPI002FDBCC85